MIRPYRKEDQRYLIDLLRLNTPQFFAPSEEKDYLDYLEREAEAYFVVERAGVIIGAGGCQFGFDKGETARIAWDLIHPEYQGRGIGSELTRFRIEVIKAEPGVQKIVVRTSQLAHAFYGKHGFQLMRIEKDFWAPGFDLYQMEMTLR